MSEDLKNLTPDKIKELLAKAKERRSKIVQVPFRHVIEVDWFRRFTWKERVKILFGYNFLVMSRTPTLHKPGELGSIFIGHTSKHPTASAYMRDQAKAALKDQFGDLLPQDAMGKTTL